MRQLIVARHGEYDEEDRHLNNDGREQNMHLAEQLKPLMNGASALIITSTADRANESANIIGDSLQVVVEPCPILNTDKYADNFPTLLKIIHSRQNQADILVLVTHSAYVEYFPAYFAEKELGIKLDSHYIPCGTAWIVNCNPPNISWLH